MHRRGPCGVEEICQFVEGICTYDDYDDYIKLYMIYVYIYILDYDHIYIYWIYFLGPMCFKNLLVLGFSWWEARREVLRDASPIAVGFDSQPKPGVSQYIR